MPSNVMAIADSVGWALLHSIWQVALISGLVFLALRLMPRDNPQLRFLTAYLGMAGSALAFLVTFTVYYRASSGTPVIAAEPTGWAVYLDMLGQMTWLVSLCWAFGFGALGIRYVQALRATYRLRHVGVSQVPEKWETRFRLWLERLGGDPQASILYSDRIGTPVTIGTFKPVILMPIGFFLRMPAEQAEAILVHEIAHVCRQDYLLGLIQAMIANIFFFHPGIYYLSRQVDIEREYACDDRAARETGNAGPLAEALSRIAMERDSAALGFAMAADGPRTPIMDRINRLGGRPVRGGGTGVPMAGLSMAFAASLMIAVGADASVGKSKNQDPAEDEWSDGQARALTGLASEDAESQSKSATSGDSPRIEQWSAETVEPGAAGRTEEECCEQDDERQSSARHDTAPLTGERRRTAPAKNRRAITLTAARVAPVRAQFTNAALWQIDGPEQSAEQCEDQSEHARERHEHRIERERAQAEREAERAQARAEQQSEREAARIERRMERLAARLESQAERLADNRARRMEWIADKMSEQFDHDADRPIDVQMERRGNQLIISFTPPVPPAVPAAAPVRTLTLSFDGTSGTL